MNISYRKFKPSAALQPYVDCYWCVESDGAAGEESPVQRCLPFGMIEVIFMTRPNSCAVCFDGVWQDLPPAFVTGLYKDAVIWKSKGKMLKFGIRMKPECLMQLFKVTAASLFSAYTELETFFGREIARLSDRMLGAAGPEEMVTTAEAFLTERLTDMQEERHYVSEATRMIRQSKGGLSIQSLSDSLYISKRQLERIFKDHMGTSPKTYTRIIRFRHAYEYMQQDDAAPSWTDITYDLGYSDQAHFIRDFKSFAGDVPTTMLQAAARQKNQIANMVHSLAV